MGNRKPTSSEAFRRSTSNSICAVIPSLTRYFICLERMWLWTLWSTRGCCVRSNVLSCLWLPARLWKDSGRQQWKLFFEWFPRLTIGRVHAEECINCQKSSCRSKGRCFFPAPRVEWMRLRYTVMIASWPCIQGVSFSGWWEHFVKTGSIYFPEPPVGKLIREGRRLYSPAHSAILLPVVSGLLPNCRPSASY